MKKTITICDRCKREYKPQTASENAKNPRMYGFGEVDLDNANRTDYIYNLDLCDECYRELIKWWEKYDFKVTETYEDVTPELGSWTVTNEYVRCGDE